MAYTSLASALAVQAMSKRSATSLTRHLAGRAPRGREFGLTRGERRVDVSLELVGAAAERLSLVRRGSRDEIQGRTGVSHWVEHMQFKGTEQFPANMLDKAISREGGTWNAMTYLDWTAYYETMPADKIDLALRLEADRMVNSRYDKEEVASERTVISEREGNENEPLFQLGEAIQQVAFRIHPYHHEVIGDMADLLSMTRDDLYEHYRTFYVPNNAVLALAGDFEDQGRQCVPGSA